MVVTFDKNVFFSNEIAYATVTVDNALSQLQVTEVEFQVSQNLRINGSGSFHHSWSGKFDILENKDRSGIAAGAQEKITKRMGLDLSQIKYQIDTMKKCKGKGMFAGKTTCPRSPEEMFMLSQLAPATHSKHILNDYVLNVNVKFDGCTCCSSLPNISVPLTVIPMTH